jgi:hypothetical protein
MAGFWKNPRALFWMLVNGNLSTSEWAVLSAVGQAGADRTDGVVATIELLARALRLNERTVRRALRSLRARGLVAYDDHPGSIAFVVRTTRELAALCEAEPRTQLGHSSDIDPPPVSEVASDMPASAAGRDPALTAGSAADATSDTRARARRQETETDPLSPPEGGSDEEHGLNRAPRRNPRHRRLTPEDMERIADRIAWPEDER